jgi:hypothetical protein
MKFNKWTVALAAVGVVSLASAAKAEEKPSAVATALSSTTISGYVDTSAQWNLGSGNYNQPPYKFNSPSKADGFNLDVFQLTISKPLDETPWSAGYRADLWFGPDANTLGTTSIVAPGGPSDFAIRQAYITLNAPVGNGIDFKVGVFDSILGYESVESPNDPNYTRSYGHSMEPQTHTGVLATYHFGDAVSVSAGVADTVGPTINERPFEGLNKAGTGMFAESYKTYMGSVALTAPKSMGFLAGSTLYAGFVNGFSSHAATTGGTGSQTSYYAGSTIATPIKELQFGVAFDYLDMSMVHGQTWAAAGYASYHATEKLSFHARGEYLKDSSGFFAYADSTSLTPVLTSDTVLAMTGTVQYDLWKNVISRLELRWDHSLSGNDAFGGATADSSPDRQNAWLLAANIIYRF